MHSRASERWEIPHGGQSSSALLRIRPPWGSGLRSAGEPACGGQHLKVLKEAGLVREISQGTRRIYSLDPRGIAAMRRWLDSHWAAALDAFKQFADQQDEQELDK